MKKIILFICLTIVPIDSFAGACFSAPVQRAPLRSRNLLDATRKGDLNEVKIWLEKGANLEDRDSVKQTALHLAAGKGYTEIALALIHAGADVNALTRRWHNICGYNDTPLNLAAQQGHTAIVSALVERKANVEMKDSQGYAPLYWAVITNSTEIVRLLVQAGADVHVNAGGLTLVGIAKKQNNIEMGNILVAAGAQRIGNFPPVPQNESILFAVERNNLSQVENLISQKATLELVDERTGQTGLILAAKNGSTEIVRSLVRAGADLNATDNEWKTALFWSRNKGHAAITSILLDAGAVNQPLLDAVRENNLVQIRNLISEGANLEELNQYRETPLLIAVQKGYTQIVSALIQAGADVDARNKQNNTALHLAAQEGQNRIVSALIDAKVDLDSKNSNGATAIILAVQKNHASVVQLLTQAGANVHEMSVDGKTAIQIARTNGNGGIASILLCAGAYEPSAPTPVVQPAPAARPVVQLVPPVYPPSYSSYAPSNPPAANPPENYRRPLPQQPRPFGGMTTAQELRLVGEIVREIPAMVNDFQPIVNDFQQSW